MIGALRLGARVVARWGGGARACLAGKRKSRPRQGSARGPCTCARTLCRAAASVTGRPEGRGEAAYSHKSGRSHLPPRGGYPVNRPRWRYFVRLAGEFVPDVGMVDAPVAANPRVRGRPRMTFGTLSKRGKKARRKSGQIKHTALATVEAPVAAAPMSGRSSAARSSYRR